MNAGVALVVPERHNNVEFERVEAWSMSGHESHEKRIAAFWVGVFLLAASTETVAQQCFEQAPSALGGGDPYEAITPTRFGTEERRQIEQLFKRLEGHWSGSSKGYFCRGTRDAIRKEANDYRIEMNATSDSPNELVLTSNLTSMDNSTIRTETLHLYLSDNTLRADRDDKAGDVAILQLPRDGRSIEFVQKVITNPASAGVQVRETLHQIQVSANNLTMKFTVYFIGGLASESTWKLTRK